MKKLLIIFIAVFAFIGTKNSTAQNLVVGGEIGFSLLTANGSNLALPIGANVEWDINGKLSLEGRLAYDIRLGSGNFGVFYISPEIRYHFSEVFSGAYVGGYIGFGPASPGSNMYLSVGAVGGYEIMISDHFNLDISGQLGYGRVSNSYFSANGLHFRPTVGLRYAISK